MGSQLGLSLPTELTRKDQESSCCRRSSRNWRQSGLRSGEKPIRSGSGLLMPIVASAKCLILSLIIRITGAARMKPRRTMLTSTFLPETPIQSSTTSGGRSSAQRGKRCTYWILTLPMAWTPLWPNAISPSTISGSGFAGNREIRCGECAWRSISAAPHAPQCCEKDCSPVVAAPLPRRLNGQLREACQNSG